MSVVVAVRDEGSIWLAADSQVTSGFTKGLLTSTNNFKLSRTKEGIIIGGVGSLRDLNIVFTADRPWFTEGALLKNEIKFPEIVRFTVPSLFDELRKHKRIAVEDGIEVMQSIFIFAYKETCFVIQQDGAVLELDDMFATGSGGDVAESAYTILRDVDLGAKEKAVRVVMSSCERDLFVDYPILVANTERDYFEIFNGQSFFKINPDGSVEEIPEEEDVEECDCNDDKECNCGDVVEEKEIQETDEELDASMEELLRGFKGYLTSIAKK